MAGVEIKVTVQSKPIRDALVRLQKKDGGLYRAGLKNIGVEMVRRSRRRFVTKTDPQGAKWRPLNPLYAKGKKGTGILSESGQLAMSIVWQISGNVLYVGTNKIYGAMQQFGGTIVPRNGDFLVFRMGGKLIFARKVTLPARAYLGVSADDERAIVTIVEDHIAEVWNGAG